MDKSYQMMTFLVNIQRRLFPAHAHLYQFNYSPSLLSLKSLRLVVAAFNGATIFDTVTESFPSITVVRAASCPSNID